MTNSCSSKESLTEERVKKPWRFAVLSDTHVTYNNDKVKEMIPYLLEDQVEFVLICGDLIEGGKNTNAIQMKEELDIWKGCMQPLIDKGVKLYAIRGNHENDVNNNMTVWNNFFSNDLALPQNGPEGETNLTYSFKHKNALIIGLDTYVSPHSVHQNWLDATLDVNNQTHVFAFGHEPAFKVFHSDCLDDDPITRNAFWQSLSKAGARTYFCGHDHFYDVLEIDDRDTNLDNNISQIVIGGGGGWLMSKYNHNGDNEPYAIKAMDHQMAFGYLLVELSGEHSSDVGVSIQWKSKIDAGYTAIADKISYEAIPK